MIRESINESSNAALKAPSVFRPAKLSLILFGALIVSGCALPSVVQRQTVEYNTAAAAMANQLALMNIIRAEQHLPIFYTSISRLSGSTVVTATGGFNAAIKTASPVDTESVTNAPATTAGSTTTTPPTAPVGAINSVAQVNSITTTVTNLASRAVTSGGNLYTPSIGGQVVSGPSFDINILDTQQFYQGVLAEIPFSTVELFINQGFDNQLIMRLLIERIEYRNPDDSTLVRTIYNVPGGSEALEFLRSIACVRLIGDAPTKVAPIAPISRVTGGEDGETKKISLKDLAILDGQKFTLAKQDGDHFRSDNVYIPYTTSDDNKIYIVRPPPDKRLPHLDASAACVVPTPLKAGGSLGTAIGTNPFLTLRSDVISHNIRSAATVAFASTPGQPLDAIIYFRSPEGLIRFLGNYLAQFKRQPDSVYAFGPGPLFSVAEGHASSALVSTVVSGETYSITKHDNPETNMTVLALVEELVNLQKSAVDRPVTVPVHVLP